MKKFTVTLALLAGTFMTYAQYTAIATTGYNEDIVAETTPAATTTSLSMDGSDFVFYSQAYGTASGSTKGLPDNLIVSSAGYSFELQSYTGNNALFLRNPNQPSGQTDTLEITSPANYSSLSVLCVSTEGQGLMSAQIIFSDGTSETTSGHIVKDWFNGTNYIMTNIDRVGRSTDNIANIFNNPRLYSVDIPVSCANETKSISKIVFTNQSTTNGRIYIMGLAGSGQLSVTLGNTFDLICNNGNDGFAEAVVTGGQAPYSYNWTNGPTTTTNTVNTLSAGAHKCIVTDNRGCQDSTAIFTLTEPAPISVTENATTCQGYPYVIGNNYYYNAGTYTTALTAANGCDSLVVTNLTVTPAPEYTENVSICAGSSYQIGNSTYTDAGTYTNTLYSSSFCDSVVITVLTVTPAPEYTQNVSICAGDSYNIGANSYTTAGTYTDTLSATTTCDSIVITTLTVADVIAEIDASSSTFSSVNQATNFTYQWLDCNNGNQAIAGETNATFNVTQNGSYALVVSNGTCTDTSECYIVDNVGIENNETSFIAISPNPTTGLVKISGNNIIKEAVVFTTQGKQVNTIIQEDIKSIDLTELPSGVYFVQLTSVDNQQHVIRLVKQ
ncbi:Por secretion system C-terminal sorting domain-containing protein [Lishizhenia tianjinensis]|uniref:Por secretion system C-terminal sorting domain-containing protein n=1 Tax=Lishizhenia tianjinensis TaxID=477690 RepID=A0A1I6XH13_9FLAO|nr:T9SS type A sorting domain-containing protein [Lishizhenia tianjinensis]SFT37393.1 Por secretion system C-terminal sorting domain-containing protein [Lishizhenia tianjinensis]